MFSLFLSILILLCVNEGQSSINDQSIFGEKTREGGVGGRNEIFFEAEKNMNLMLNIHPY